MNAEMEQSVDAIMENAYSAYKIYSQTDKRNKRASFLREIAVCIEHYEKELIDTAAKECRLPESRVLQEFERVIGQLRMFARLLEEGSWVEASIDTADPHHKPLPQPDVRRMLQPIGPVIILSGGNSPFALFAVISNMISALAAGSTVVVKADARFIYTSTMLFEIIHEEVKVSGMPLATTQYITGLETLTKQLIQHPATTGVAYTGTIEESRLLAQYAMERCKPIPLFAEMDSINPVIVYPEFLQMYPAETAGKLAYSVMPDAGRHTTTPRLILAMEGYGLPDFIHALEKEIRQTETTTSIIKTAGSLSGSAFSPIVKMTGYDYLQKNISKGKLSSAYALLVICRGSQELKAILKSLDGQLTTTLMATEHDMERHRDIMQLQQLMAGRIIVNDMPTEEAVCYSMVHGGAYPAASDVRYTSSGALAIKRWMRPVCCQNFPQQFLPDELKNDNPLHIMRLINNEWRH